MLAGYALLKPLLFMGGVGVGAVRYGQTSPEQDRPHPSIPSPEEEGRK